MIPRLDRRADRLDAGAIQLDLFDPCLVFRHIAPCPITRTPAKAVSVKPGPRGNLPMRQKIIALQAKHDAPSPAQARV
jgi:hypothetical protein